MIHENEICYWARHEDGTEVWMKSELSNDWELLMNPYWHKNRKYITNDEWAELRKAQADGKQLQYDDGTWMNRELKILHLGLYLPSEWRIKPEEVYEWQWVFKYNHDDKFGITSSHFATKEKCQEFLDTKELRRTVLYPFEPSKRIRK